MDSLKKEKVITRTLTSLKVEIKKRSDELQTLDSAISKRKAEVKALREETIQEKQKLGEFLNHVATVVNSGVKSIGTAASQRKLVVDSTNKLNVARLALEIEIAEKKKQKVPSLTIADQVIATAKKTLTKLDRDNVSSLEMKNKLVDDKKRLTDANAELKASKVKQEKALKELEVQAKEIEKQREANLKELARETANIESIKKRERQAKALNYQLSERFLKVYSSKKRRNPIKP